MEHKRDKKIKKRNIIKRVKMLLKNEYAYLTLFFIISLTLVFFMRKQTLSWDFICYRLNAQHMVGQSAYYEIYRPPLISLLMIPFGIFNWKFSEYAVSVLILLLYYYSIYELSKTIKFKKISRIVFVLLASSPSLIFYGLIDGTEMLSISLIILSIVNLIRGKYNGHYLALAFLARYNMWPFFVFGIVRKKTWKNFGLLLLVLSPWLVLNQVFWHNPFYSYIDAFAMNVYFRNYIHNPVRIINLLSIDFFLTIFGTLGLAVGALGYKKIKTKAMFWIASYIAIITILGYLKVPIKSERYLYNLLIPSAYFSTILFNNLSRKWRTAFVVTFIIFLGIEYSAYAQILSFDSKYYTLLTHDILKAKEVMNEKGISCCTSNIWPYFNYFGVKCEAQIKLREQNVKDYLHHSYFVYIPDGGIGYKPFKEEIYNKTFNYSYFSRDVIILGKPKKCYFNSLVFNYMKKIRREDPEINQSFPSLFKIALNLH